MASFTDAISQFNPYVQQLPIEAMKEVGMYKQAKYEQGVQGIQSEIDKVAGLDIVKPIHRQYLQSKLNELGSKLKTVAAGDFSNFQLVNSVGGMATQIGKDPIIQNATAWTSLYRKGLQEIQKDDSEGKSNPNNTKEYMNQANTWLSDNNLDTPFADTYFKPRDVWGKLKDIAKEVGLDEKTVQELYQTDEKGNRLYKDVVDKKGNVIGKEPIWNPIMVEKHLKDKDAGKILGAFQTALTPDDYKQLAIDGKWGMESYTPDMLKEEIRTRSVDQIDATAAKIQGIKLALYNENQKNVKNDERINSLNQQLDYFTKYKGKLDSDLERNIKSVDTNPDAVKASLYTNKYLQTMSEKLSSHDEDVKYSVSPMFEVIMKQNEFNRQVQQDKIQNAHWQKDYDLKVGDLAYKMQKDASDADKDKLELYLKYGIGDGGKLLGKVAKVVKEPLKLQGNEFTIKNQVEDDYSTAVQDLNQTNDKLAFQYFKKINPGKSDEQIRQAMYNYAKANKESLDVASGDVNTFAARFAAKQLQAWSLDPTSVPAEFNDLIEKQSKLTKDVSIQKGRIEKTKDDALRIAKERGLDAPTKEELNKAVKGATVSLSGGDVVSLTKEDVLDFANLRPDLFNSLGAITSDKNQESLATQSLKRLKLKYGNRFNEIQNQIYYSPKAIPGLGAGREAVAIHPAVEQAGQFIKASNYGKLAAIESEIYLKGGMIKQPISVPVVRGKENKEDRNALISDIIGKYKDSLNETPGFSEKAMQSALLSTKPNAVSIRVTPGASAYDKNKYELRLVSDNGDTASVTIDEDDFETIQGYKFSNLPIPEVVKQLNYNGTSNLSGTENPTTAWFKANSFKNLSSKDYTTTADLIPDQNNPDKLWFKIYLNYKDGRPTQPITYGQPFYKYNQDGTINQDLDDLPLGINDAVIQQLKMTK
jgi:hypothetical protein